MGHPGASPQNKHFAAFFTHIVTSSTESWKTTVTRSGPGGVFWVFARCFPNLVRQHSRHGLTQLEFNKILAHEDFPIVRKRNRMASPADSRVCEDCFPTSSFRFASRRWRNPDSAEDLAYLKTAWPLVANGMNAVLFEEFLVILRQALHMDQQGGDDDHICSHLLACTTPSKKSRIDGSDYDGSVGNDDDDDDSSTSDMDFARDEEEVLLDHTLLPLLEVDRDCEVAKEVGCHTMANFDSSLALAALDKPDEARNPDLLEFDSALINCETFAVTGKLHVSHIVSESWIDANTDLDSGINQQVSSTSPSALVRAAYCDVLTAGSSREFSFPSTKKATFADVCASPVHPSAPCTWDHGPARTFDEIADEALQHAIIDSVGVFDADHANNERGARWFEEVLLAEDRVGAPDTGDAQVLRLLAIASRQSALA